MTAASIEAVARYNSEGSSFEQREEEDGEERGERNRENIIR